MSKYARLRPSKFARSQPPSASPNSLDHSLHVYLETCMIIASNCISKLVRLPPPSTSSRSDGGCTEIQLLWRWIQWREVYSADPVVDRHHLISISSYHSVKLHTPSFPTFGLTCSVRDVVDPCNCMDSQRWVVSCLLTWFLRSFSWITFGCRERCGGVLMVGSLPSSSIVSLQWHPSGVSLSSLNGCVQVLLWLCSTTICGQIERMYIYAET